MSTKKNAPKPAAIDLAAELGLGDDKSAPVTVTMLGHDLVLRTAHTGEQVINFHRALADETVENYWQRLVAAMADDTEENVTAFADFLSSLTLGAAAKAINSMAIHAGLMDGDSGFRFGSARP